MNPTLTLTEDERRLGGRFLHFCYDWDGMLIDHTDPEFECCNCEFE